MGSREDRNVSQLRLPFAGKRIDLRNPLHLVPEELHPVSVSARVSRINLQHITSYAETASLKIHIISCILDVDKLVNYLVPVFFHPRPQGNYHLLIIDRTSQTINTRHGGHNDYILPLRQRSRGGVAQLVYLVIDGRVLFNVCVC